MRDCHRRYTSLEGLQQSALICQQTNTKCICQKEDNNESWTIFKKNKSIEDLARNIELAKSTAMTSE